MGRCIDTKGRETLRDPGNVAASELGCRKEGDGLAAGTGRKRAAGGALAQAAQSSGPRTSRRTLSRRELAVPLEVTPTSCADSFIVWRLCVTQRI